MYLSIVHGTSFTSRFDQPTTAVLNMTLGPLYLEQGVELSCDSYVTSYKRDTAIKVLFFEG